MPASNKLDVDQCHAHRVLLVQREPQLHPAKINKVPGTIAKYLGGPIALEVVDVSNCSHAEANTSDVEGNICLIQDARSRQQATSD